MKIETAKAAIGLADQIENLQRAIAMIDTMIQERWQIVKIQFVAPATDSKSPEGTIYDLFLFDGKANLQNSRASLDEARATYDTLLKSLVAQLDML